MDSKLDIQEYIKNEINNTINNDTKIINLDINNVNNKSEENISNILEENSNNLEDENLELDVKTVKISDSIDALKKMLKYVNISFEDIGEIIGYEIDRDLFLNNEIVDYYQTFKNLLKNTGYTSGKLTSLHNNNTQKQKFPAVNMLRQVLKCNGLLLKPKVKSIGYTKTGRKLIKRSYMISLN